MSLLNSDDSTCNYLWHFFCGLLDFVFLVKLEWQEYNSDNTKWKFYNKQETNKQKGGGVAPIKKG